ncbi:MAG: LLM class flavin-dependent oxidoreductase, partial [Acidimicrobiia bacterium]|nr:LLM class flavin-dependent oxidoreductase [Acidimicrobiia bacterium]
MPSHELTFGVFIPQGWKMELVSIEDPQAKWAKAVEIATLAEESGLDSLWVYDHFHNVPVPAHETMFECWTTLATISQRTSRIKLGQMVGCAPYRNPGLLAKITSNIDVMSGGRLIWGVGAGWYDHEFKGYGYEFPPAKDRIRMLRETVEIVKAMWTEPDVSYKGKFFTLDGAQCDPKPVQLPHPEVLIGGGGEQLTLRVVARH